MQGVWDYRNISQAEVSIHQAPFFPRKERSSAQARQDPRVQINTHLDDQGTSTLGHNVYVVVQCSN